MAQLQHCLAVALRDEDGVVMRKAHAVCLIRGASKGYMLLRARVCAADLQCTTFLVGVGKATGEDAFDLAAATQGAPGAV